MTNVNHSEIARNMALKEIAISAADHMWANVSPHEANAGLEIGRPELDVAKRCHKSLLAREQAAQASSLDAVVVKNVWENLQGHSGLGQVFVITPLNTRG